MKMTLHVRSVTFGVKKKLKERKVLPSLTYGAQILGMHEKIDERHKLDVTGMTRLRISAELPQ